MTPTVADPPVISPSPAPVMSPWWPPALVDLILYFHARGETFGPLAKT